MPLAGNRVFALPNPSAWRLRFIRSALSSRSWMVKSGFRPMAGAFSRRILAPTAWKVPAQVSASAAAEPPSARAAMVSTRRVSSTAARREKVISRMRRGSAPLTSRCATRCASVEVLPDPAPAITSSGGGIAPGAIPKAAAARCRSFSPARWLAACILRPVVAGGSGAMLTESEH